MRFFASRLKWSRFTHVTVVPDEREEALGARPVLQAFEGFGGVPLVTVRDNPKTVVLARKGELIVWNPIFGQVALDSRFPQELCWPRAGQQKGAVENLVGRVKKSFSPAGASTIGPTSNSSSLTDWLRTVNTALPSRATGVIPAVRLAEERARLRPRPSPARAYALKTAVVVRARARVTHTGREYSMPPPTIDQAATLHLYDDHVEILTKTGERVRHPRSAARAGLLPEHRAAILDTVRGAWRGCTFKTLDEYDFIFQSTVRLSLLGSALGPEFITQRHSLVFSGPSGTGKTPLAVHRLPRHPEWLRRALHHRDGADRGPLDRHARWEAA